MMFNRSFTDYLRPHFAAIESTTGFVTAPGAAFGVAGSVAAVSSGTLTVRDFKMGNAYILDLFRNGQAAGAVRLRSPKFHDNVQGIRVQLPTTTQRGLPLGFPQQVYAQDTLILEDTGSAVAGDIENVGYTVYYQYPTSSNAKLIGLDELERRMALVPGGQTIFTPSFTLVGAVTGAFGATVALSAALTGDLSKANTDYALLGIMFTETAVNNAAAVSVQGPDTGNFQISIPAMQSDLDNIRPYFIDMCRKYKGAFIPVVNSANKGGTFFAVLNNENANTATVTAIFAQLG